MLLVGQQEGLFLACKKYGGGGHWLLVRMDWRPSGWSVCLPLLIFLCTIKSRSFLLAPAHPGGPGKRAVKRLWWWWFWGEPSLGQFPWSFLPILLPQETKHWSKLKALNPTRENHPLASSSLDPVPDSWVKGSCALYTISPTPVSYCPVPVLSSVLNRILRMVPVFTNVVADHFNGPGRAIVLVCVSLCPGSNFWTERSLTLIFCMLWSCSAVRVIGQSSHSQRKRCC